MADGPYWAEPVRASAIHAIYCGRGVARPIGIFGVGQRLPDGWDSFVVLGMNKLNYCDTYPNLGYVSHHFSLLLQCY